MGLLRLGNDVVSSIIQEAGTSPTALSATKLSQMAAAASRASHSQDTVKGAHDLVNTNLRMMSVVGEVDIQLSDGRTLHAYDARTTEVASRPTAPSLAGAVIWLHGSPNVGSPPEPLFPAAEASGLCWVSYDRCRALLRLVHVASSRSGPASCAPHRRFLGQDRL